MQYGSKTPSFPDFLQMIDDGEADQAELSNYYLCEYKAEFDLLSHSDVSVDLGSSDVLSHCADEKLAGLISGVYSEYPIYSIVNTFNAHDIRQNAGEAKLRKIIGLLLDMLTESKIETAIRNALLQFMIYESSEAHQFFGMCPDKHIPLMRTIARDSSIIPIGFCEDDHLIGFVLCGYWMF